MEKITHYHTDSHGFSLTTPTRENIINLLDQLPTLDEVLQRQSRPPVCLYNYYIVLRDRLQMETLLDFWLDVQQAEVLYRRYLKQQAKKQNSKTNISKSVPRSSTQSPIESISATSFASQPEMLTHMLLMQPKPFSTPKRSTTVTTSITTTSSSSSLQSSPPQHYPSQSEMVDTNERIYYRYIVPHAEKELLQLPTALRDKIIHAFNSNAPLDDPKVFQNAKRYVHILLQSSFTLFIRYKVFMNLTLPQQLLRLAAGLFFLLVGFSLEFSLIFLNMVPWSLRLWVSPHKRKGCRNGGVLICLCAWTRAPFPSLLASTVFAQVSVDWIQSGSCVLTSGNMSSSTLSQSLTLSPLLKVKLPPSSSMPLSKPRSGESCGKDPLFYYLWWLVWLSSVCFSFVWYQEIDFDIDSSAFSS